ncbi:hypothetical protein [Demequina sp.]|uniref:hypothetical protein n=1 Tax=Demequina sp. TaxID=2050685 RepID=UPI003A8BC535
MMNSRYAPVVALGALGVIVVLVLGWFLAVSPKLGEASEIRSRAEAIDGNTVLIEAASGQLDALQVALNEVPDFTPAIELNAPSARSVTALRQRVSEAEESSGAQVYVWSGGAASAIDGIVAEPETLASNSVAGLFAKGPIDLAEGAAQFAPVVKATTVAGPVVERLYGVPISITVTGTPEEVFDFLTAVTDAEDPVMQFATVEYASRQSDSPALPGVDDAEDGDVIATLEGFTYVLNPSNEVLDEDALAPATLPGTSPFEEIEGSSGSSGD